MKPVAKLSKFFLDALSLMVIILPTILKCLIYRRIYGYKIGERVKIGLSWIRVGKLEVGDDVVIGHLNRFKGTPEVRIGNNSIISSGNTFTSTLEFTDNRGIALRKNQPKLIIGDHCGISLWHYFDIQDTVSIGSFTTIAGIGSVFFTHFIDIMNGKQSTKPINIGAYNMIGSSVRFLPGAGVSDFCVVGMASVVTKMFSKTHVLIGGNPAKVIHELPESAAYFKRSIGRISSF